MKTIILICLFLSSTLVVFATGPSEIISEMVPVAVASDGSVLCKTRQMSNKRGALMLMPYTFGWAIVSPSGQIEKYPQIQFKGDAGYEKTDEAYKRLAELEMYYESGMNLELAQKKIAKVSTYDFKKLKKEHKVNRQYSYKTFAKKYPLVDQQVRQFSLEKVQSSYTPTSMHVAYKIGNLLFLENKHYFDMKTEKSVEIGSSFKCHPEAFSGGYYDDALITGILLIDEKVTTSVDKQGDMEIGGFYKMQVLKLDKKGFGVQIGGYSNYATVLEQLSLWESKWFKSTTIFVGELNDKPYYRIVLGPLNTKEEAKSYCENLRKKYQLKDAFVVDLEQLK